MHSGIGDFLRNRRGRLSPADVGLQPATTARRVTGLRREELAALAGVSVDYYVRLEQGRAPHVSDGVLSAIGRALRLTPAEQEHLNNLARQDLRKAETTPSDEDLVLFRLIEMSEGVPALLLNANLDLLRSNRLAERVFGISHTRPERNLVRITFLDRSNEPRVRNYDVITSQMIAYLRMRQGRYPGDTPLAEMISTLKAQSAAFVRAWERHDVDERTIATVLIDHPEVGEMRFTNVWLGVSPHPDRIIVFYTVEHGSLSEERLKALAAQP